jgi:hypothetical protein
MGGMLASAPAQADWVPPFKGNDTGGIIAYSLATQADARQLAVDHCASYGKVVKFLAIQANYGGYISFACRWVPITANALRTLTERSPPNQHLRERSMPRQFVIGWAIVAGPFAAAASAVELPVRKAGLWEMKTMRAGSSTPDMTMQQCTDESTDKAMSTAFSPMAKESCSKNDIQKTANGYVGDSVCSFGGMSMTSHSETTGDFNSAYTVKSTSTTKGGPPGVPGDSTTIIEAKWLGACKPDQKPGDIMMPGGMKMNIKDMEKIKGLLPKPPAK